MMFEDLNLLESIGALTAVGDVFGGGGNSVPTVDEILDPAGFNRAQGLDPYGRPLPDGGRLVRPDGTPLKPQSNPLAQASNQATKTAKGIGSRIGALNEGFLAGSQPRVDAQTKALQGLIPQGPLPAKGGVGMKIGRFAGQALKNPLLQKGLAYAPVVGTALSVGDVVFGDESLANKAMDATAMTIGGAIGSVVPVVGTGLGIAAGKMASDATQWLFGDKKTPEQRKMELALQQLQGGRMI